MPFWCFFKWHTWGAWRRAEYYRWRMCVKCYKVQTARFIGHHHRWTEWRRTGFKKAEYRCCLDCPVLELRS